MKLITRCFVLVLPVLAGCKGELASVTVRLAADGSGDCEIGGVRDMALLVDERGNPGSVIEGGREHATVDVQLRQTRAKFASITDLKIGDISFALEKKDGANLLTVHIPVSPGARWFAEFGVSERTLSAWNQLEERAKKDDDARRKADPNAPRASWTMDPQKPPNASFDIHLPARLLGQDFETVPLGLTSKVAVDKAERTASLTIPLAEIQAGKLREVVWKISY
jgi:hypothetical protein